MLNWTGLTTTMTQTRYLYEVPIRKLHGKDTTPPHKCLCVDSVCSSTHGPQHWVEVNGQLYNLVNFFPKRNCCTYCVGDWGAPEPVWALYIRDGPSLVRGIELQLLGRPVLSLFDIG